MTPTSIRHIPLFLTLAASAFVACKSDSSGDDCTPGSELCSCVSGQCLSGLTCDLATSTCVLDTSGTGGGPEEREQALCERLDACNYLEAGVSASDCADELRVCTGDLIQSQLSDWTALADDCLDLANCKNFFACQSELPDCSPDGGGGGACVMDGNPCDYCWGQTSCPLEYLGAADGCDCDCANGPDPDCG